MKQSVLFNRSGAGMQAAPCLKHPKHLYFPKLGFASGAFPLAAMQTMALHCYKKGYRQGDRASQY